MIFEFPSARKFSYVRRSFGNGGSLRDDPKNGCEGDYRTARFVISFFFFVPQDSQLSLSLSLGKPGSYFFFK